MHIIVWYIYIIFVPGLDGEETLLLVSERVLPTLHRIRDLSLIGSVRSTTSA